MTAIRRGISYRRYGPVLKTRLSATSPGAFCSMIQPITQLRSITPQRRLHFQHIHLLSPRLCRGRIWHLEQEYCAILAGLIHCLDQVPYSIAKIWTRLRARARLGGWDNTVRKSLSAIITDGRNLTYALYGDRIRLASAHIE